MGSHLTADHLLPIKSMVTLVTRAQPRLRATMSYRTSWDTSSLGLPLKGCRCAEDDGRGLRGVRGLCLPCLWDSSHRGSPAGSNQHLLFFPRQTLQGQADIRPCDTIYYLWGQNGPISSGRGTLGGLILGRDGRRSVGVAAHPDSLPTVCTGFRYCLSWI